MHLVAYVRVVSDDGLDDEAPWRTEAGSTQMKAIEEWARNRDSDVVTIAVERAPSGLDHSADRVGFLHALSQIRDGNAEAICVATLSDLDEDLVVQEFLIDEARRASVEIVSADPNDQMALSAPDGERLLVRRVIQEIPRFQGEMRSLRAWMRRSGDVDELERDGAALAELESLQEHGERLDAAPRGRFLRDGAHRIASLLRARRRGA